MDAALIREGEGGIETIVEATVEAIVGATVEAIAGATVEAAVEGRDQEAEVAVGQAGEHGGQEGHEQGGEVEHLPGMGEAPPPPVGFDQLKGMSPSQVISWLEGINYFAEFGDAAQVERIKHKFEDHGLSGLVLIKSGGDLERLIPCINYGPAVELSEIIQKINNEKGYIPPHRAQKNPSGVFDKTCYFFGKQKWIFGSSAVSAALVTGSGFHLEDLAMISIPKIMRPLANAAYHWSYGTGVCLIFAGFGRWTFEGFRKKFSHAARTSAIELEEEGLVKERQE